MDDEVISKEQGIQTEKTEPQKMTVSGSININNKTTASERGIYQLTVNKGKPEEQKYYGQFHVI